MQQKTTSCKRKGPQKTLTNISSQNILQLLLLETTLDDKLTLTGNGTRGTQLGEQELSDVLVGSLHAATDFGNVCENGLLVSFAQALRRGDLVRLAAARGKIGVVVVELGEEAGEQQGVLDGCGVAVLPDAGSLFEIALLGGGLLHDGLVVVGLVVGAGLGQLGLKVVGFGLLGLLLLLLEGRGVEFGVGGGGLCVVGRLFLLG